MEILSEFQKEKLQILFLNVNKIMVNPSIEMQYADGDLQCFFVYQLDGVSKV